MLTFLIMAGGSGERFWPLSTKEKPKQLLKIFSNKSLIRLAYERILPLVDKDQIFIATNEIQLKALKEELPEINDSRIIIEPAFRDTASAISYGSLMISKYYDNPTICVLASDHLIVNEDEFRKVIKLAEIEAEKSNIVTLGIKPEYPETGYGYIEVDEVILNKPTKALAFKEKPNLEIAKVYFNSGKYLWNSGMFIFKYNTILEALRQYSPNHYEVSQELNKLINTNNGVITANKVRDTFIKFEKKSIDYAVMEKANNIVVIPTSFGWNDVGSYLAFDELFNKDENNNVIYSVKSIAIDSTNNIIISQEDNHNINLLGINNMVIVITKDNLLIIPKDRCQEIKKILAKV